MLGQTTQSMIMRSVALSEASTSSAPATSPRQKQPYTPGGRPSSPFNMVRGMAEALYSRNSETQSPFDRTKARTSILDPPARHERLLDPVDPIAFTFTSRPTEKLDPRQFLHSRSGFGGAAATLQRTSRSLSPVRPLTVSALTRPISPPPRAGASSPRRNPPNTELRHAFERRDLPCVIEHRGVRNRLAWKVEVSRLDLGYYLPLFFDGLRELEYPYKLIVEEGIRDLLAYGGPAGKVLSVVPQLILPLKNALNTRIADVMLNAMNAMKLLLLCDMEAETGPQIAGAFLPYYRQLLPVFNIFVRSQNNIGDGIDYGQQKCRILGDRIEELLNILERFGGPHAFVNIKYLIPTYESCVGPL